MGKVFRVVIGLCVVAICAAAGIWGTQQILSQGGSGEAASAPPAVRVEVTRPETRQIEDRVSGVGTLIPVRSVELVPTSAGRVTGVPVSSGEEVTEGEVIVQLDERAARAALAEAEATYAEAEDAFRRVEELTDNNAAAEARLEEARAAYRRAEAALMMTRADLEDRTLLAPFDGVLGLIDIETGTFLSEGMAVTRLADISTMELTVSLPERYFDRIRVGQAVNVTTPAYPDAEFDGEVTVRAPEVNLETRSFNIRAEIDNADGRLVGGMFADAEIVLDTYEGLAIADDAIISEGLASYVYTVADDAAVRTEIEPGQSLGSMTEVRDGLALEDRVVVAGWDNLSDGASVEVAEEVDESGDAASQVDAGANTQ